MVVVFKNLKIVCERRYLMNLHPYYSQIYANQEEEAGRPPRPGLLLLPTTNELVERKIAAVIA